MSEPLTTASNFEPDFEAAAIHIEKWALELLGSEKAVASARDIYADCQRQAAAAGLVMVDQELLDAAHKWFQGEISGHAGYVRERNRARLIGEIRDDVLRRRRDDLAATPEPAPGGDG